MMVSSDQDSMDELIREIEKGELHVIISMEIRKFRKMVTLISGLQDRSDAKEITTQLKSRIGTGGSFKDGKIQLQGDHREVAKSLLVGLGFDKKSIEVQ